LRGAFRPRASARAAERRRRLYRPSGVDPWGENGEFHTFVHAGPVFRTPIACILGYVVERDGFVFADLTAA
jgi:diphthamide synthase (EF-2-diphthine--ammonia ligase)